MAIDEGRMRQIIREERDNERREREREEREAKRDADIAELKTALAKRDDKNGDGKKDDDGPDHDFEA